MASSKNQNEPPSWLLDDIKWLSAEPGLLRDTPSSLEIIQKTCRSLTHGQIEFDNDQIFELSSLRQGAIGRFFETLVQTIISLSPEVEIIHPNVVIMAGKKTCGELDLLYKRSGNWIHLELAVKFYIGLENRRDPFNWHGPAARDTLGRKLGRMTDHQLRLPETEAGQIALKNLNISDVQSEALVMGRLFHPYSSWQQKKTIVPEMISKNHLVGWWLKNQDMSRLCEKSEIVWQILSKPDWLSPIKDPLNEDLTGNQLLKFLNSNPLPHPVMVAALKNSVECHRGFIVPGDWPAMVEARA